MISIIIPTLNNCDNLLKPCVESIIKYSNMVNIEIIIVANGCTDNTEKYVLEASRVHNIRLLWFDKPLGYTKAVNYGIKASKGDYIVLLNNDTVFLEQEKDTWINMLLEPFNDEKMGITGPSLSYCPFCMDNFIIFFCVMIKKELFEKIGLLDESFNPGFGEDSDFCVKAKNLGYEIQQVPDDLAIKDNIEINKVIGNFPIYHEGEKTIDFLNTESPIKQYFNISGKELINRNRLILANRYAKGKLKLNLGCGERKFDGCINIDLYNPYADIYMDFRKLQFEDNSAKEIIGIHIFEHIVAYEVMDVLNEWYRVLTPGGKLILEMPDILESCKNFEKSNKQQRYEILNTMYGINIGEGQTHYFGWYDEILFDHLAGAGFKNMIKKEPEFNSWGYNMRVEATK